MADACPHCGQRLRTGWKRCPRCRQPGESLTSAVATAPSGHAGRWLAVGALASLAVAGILLLNGRAVGPVAPAAAPAAEEAPARDSTQPALIANAISREHQAIDSARTGGTAYLQGDLTRAQREFESAVAASPEHAGARNNLGQVLVRQGRAAEALEHLDAAVRLSPREWSYRFNRARAYGELNRLQDALTEYEVAESLFPDDHATLFNRGLILMRLRRYDDAIAVLERATGGAPDDHDLLITLGTAQVGAGKPKDARVTFERFLERGPGHAEAARVKDLLQAMAGSGQ